MSAVTPPTLEPRDQRALAEALLARLPGFVPGWRPLPGGPGQALMEVLARYLEALASSVNGAPDKNKLAFLDQLGLDLLPAQAARAAVAFTLFPGATGIAAPAGTRLGAKAEGRGESLVFETERSVGLTGSPLVEVVSVWPGRDAYADHSVDALGGRPFTLWDGLRRVPHELYLAHPVHFALAGRSAVELEIDVSRPATRALATVWEYWDGKTWRGFKEADDGTSGLTRSGTMRLEADCAETRPRSVSGRESYWIRARPRRPLPPDASAPPPELERVRVGTSIVRPIATGCTGGLAPDHAFAGAQRLDLSKLAFPLGRQAGPDSAFYFACEEAFGKPGAEVTICFSRPKTEQERADELGAAYEVDANKARLAVLAAARRIANAIEAFGEAVIAIAPPHTANDGPSQKKTELTSALQNLRLARNNLADMSGLQPLTNATAAVTTAIPQVPVDVVYKKEDVLDLPATLARLNTARTRSREAAQAARPLVDVFAALTGGPSDWAALLLLGSTGFWVKKLFDFLGGLLAHAQAAATVVLDCGKAVLAISRQVDPNTGATLATWTALDQAIKALEPLIGSPTALFGDLVAKSTDVIKAMGNVTVDIVWRRGQLVPDVPATQVKLRAARQAAGIGAAADEAALAELRKLGAMQATAAAGILPPSTDPPRLVWEYWNGSRWIALLGVDPAPARNLQASGSLKFTVKDDWEPSEVAGVTARWMRARVASGTYGRLRLVSWIDAQSGSINFFPVIEPRPPALDAFWIGYKYSSPRVPAEHCLTYNDFEWADRTREAAWRGGGFAPFTPVRDRTPSLYLGFDGGLPADLLGILFDVEERPGARPALEWEAFDGQRWQLLVAEDGTSSLSAPGVCFLPLPGVELPAGAPAIQASGTRVQLLEASAAARFRPGGRVFLREGNVGELATVAGVAGDTLTLEATLGRSYSGATVARAALPRFGTPRSWIRLRLRSDGEPPRARVRGVHPNAVWAAQIETTRGELLGSGTGEPRQTQFVSRTPVLAGEVIEVLELEGRRAAIEYPLLVEELRAQGIAEQELRLVEDERGGGLREVWVPWRGRASLAFCGPGDRAYTIERSRGRVLFGDGRHGRVLPVGSDNVRARWYRSGGSPDGNVPAGAISELLGGVIAQGVTNPLPAEGGAAGEAGAGALERGPLTLRNRRQALNAADYEALAREASPAVAVARALPGRDADGLPARGRVTVVVAPQSSDPRPAPSLELRRRVERFLAARTPASLLGALSVVGPRFLPVDVEAEVAPHDPGESGVVIARARDALTRFLHPIGGGPDGHGWPFGRDVHLSDVAALLEAVDGVDHLEGLRLRAGDDLADEVVAVPAEKLVACGELRLRSLGVEA